MIHKRLHILESFTTGALQREVSRTCIHSVTDRDDLFKARMRKRGGMLYLAIISDEHLDQLLTAPANDDGTLSVAYRDGNT